MALIRVAREADAAAMLAIYAPYVRDTAISFETEPPSEEEFQGRVRATLGLSRHEILQQRVHDATR